MGQVVDLPLRCPCCEGRKHFRAYVSGEHIEVPCSFCAGTGKRPTNQELDRRREAREAAEVTPNG